MSQRLMMTAKGRFRVLIIPTANSRSFKPNGVGSVTSRTKSVSLTASMTGQEVPGGASRITTASSRCPAFHGRKRRHRRRRIQRPRSVAISVTNYRTAPPDGTPHARPGPGEPSDSRDPLPSDGQILPRVRAWIHFPPGSADFCFDAYSLSQTDRLTRTTSELGCDPILQEFPFNLADTFPPNRASLSEKTRGGQDGVLPGICPEVRAIETSLSQGPRYVD